MGLKQEIIIMEEILKEILRDAASSARLKSLRDACVTANENLFDRGNGKTKLEPHELRQQCFLSFKLALESRSSKLASLALNGLQKLISDDRFRSNGEESVEFQLPVQFLNTVISTPTLSDEIQIEVMKLLLIITCSASCEVHGEYLIKIAEVCVETYTRAHQMATKTACRATLTQMLSSVCHRLQDSLIQKSSNTESKHKRLDLIVTDASKVLSQDVVLLLKHFSFRIQSGNNGTAAQQNPAIYLYLESIQVMLTNLSTAMQQDKDFITVIWQVLCPALIQILGSQLTDNGKRGKLAPNLPGYTEEGRGIRNAGNYAKNSGQNTLVRIVYCAAIELLRLVGSLTTLRPTLESLFHRIILYPPPQHRLEALRIIKEILGNPQRIFDLAGPYQKGQEASSPESPTEQRKSDVDLLKLIIDGVQESSQCHESAVSSASVACTVAFLGTLEDLTNGRGLSDEHVEALSKVKEPDNWEEVYGKKSSYDNPASARPPTLISGNLEDSEDENDDDGLRRARHKHIRWQLDVTEEGLESEEDCQSFSGPKTVTWAPENEEHIIENRQDLQSLKMVSRSKSRVGHMKRSGIPRAGGKSAYSSVRSKTDSGLRSKNDKGKGKDKRRFDDPLRAEEPRLFKSWSALDLQHASFDTHSLRRTRSLSAIIVKPLRSKRRLVNVDFAFFEKARKNAKMRRTFGKRGRSTFEFMKFNTDRGKMNDVHNYFQAETTHGRREDIAKLRPILRRRSLSDFDKQIGLEIDSGDERGARRQRPGKILLDGEHTKGMSRQKMKMHEEVLKSPSKETTINGIPLSKIPRQGTKATSKSKISPRTEENEKKSMEEIEKEGARNFARCLLGILPSVLSLTEVQVVDDALQQFSSDICEAVTCMALKRKNVPNFGTFRKGENRDRDMVMADPLLNADGVYVTVYETLKLNYRLNSGGYYKQRGGTMPRISQADFIDKILTSGVHIGLSRVWLGEVYRLVTTYDILGKAGYRSDSSETNRALIGLLSESIFSTHSGRLGDLDKGGSFSPIKDMESVTPAKREGMKLARRLLLATWDPILDILGVPLDTSAKIMAGNGSVGLTLMLENSLQKDHLSRERDMVCLSLDGLRRAARLCCALGIQARCEVVLSRLAEASCEDYFCERKMKDFNMAGPLRLHAAHVLSMDALLATGLELGGHAPKCWAHVFQCCMYISHLEHSHFNSAEGTVVHPANTSVGPLQETSSPLSDTSSLCDSISADESHVSHESKPNTRVNELLNPEDACRAVFALSSAVDNLFESAANLLTLNALEQFLEALVKASSRQLFTKSSGKILPASNGLQEGDSQEGEKIRYVQDCITLHTLHLYHICDVMLRCARNNTRPLLHIIKAWNKVYSHLTEAACHTSRHVAKVALTSIHDILSEMLKRRNELPHFWFHESLFRPFERLMAIEHLDEDTQNQVLYTLYELVEGFSPAIKSGWRPLFRALRNTNVCQRRPEEFDDGDQRQKLLFNMVDSFINSKSNAVFAGATMDCISCLLKFLRAADIGDLVYMDSQECSRSDTDSCTSDHLSEEACLPALHALSKISKRLSVLYIHPLSFIFYGSYSITLIDHTPIYDRPWDDSCSNSSSITGSELDSKHDSATTAQTITAIDDTGILRMWFLMIEGLTSGVITCPKRFQAHTVELLFEILRSICTVPGPHFSMFCVTHLLLPLLQSWVDRGQRNKGHWENTLQNFKQACGLATQLIVEEIGHFLGVEGASECVPYMVKFLLDLFIRCVSQPAEAIARLGCSCLRHFLLSAGPQFSEELWHIVCKGIKCIIDATLSGLKELIICFQTNSYNVSGDNGMMVKVVAKKDLTLKETSRLEEMAEQVFLLESQILVPEKKRPEESEDEDQRSYTFIICTTENKDASDPLKTRVSLQKIIVGLLANQILMQTLGSMLLENSESPAQLPIAVMASVTDSGLVQRSQDESTEYPLPGLLCYLSPANLALLFDCLLETHIVAHEFNTRPGLRSLIQKLARLPAPANLLRQSITSFAYYLNTLFQISRHDGEQFSISHIKRILTGEKTNFETPEIKKGGKEEVGMTTTVVDRHRDLLKGDRNVDWIVRRLYESCNQLSNIYLKLHTSEICEQDSGIESLGGYSTPLSSPFRLPAKFIASSSEESLESLRINKGIIEKHGRQFSPDKLFHRGFKREEDRFVEQDSRESLISLKGIYQQHHQMILRRKEDELVHLNAWTEIIATMLELLLALPTLQFKAVLPAVFSSVTSLITTVCEPRVRQLVCDVVRRCGAIYGII